jgi:predicted nucleic acid-binding protein
MIVVDASVVLELLLRTATGRRAEERLFRPNETLHVPHLLDLEVAQVLRRYCASGALLPARAEEALEDLINLPMARYPHAVLLPRIWELRHNVTAYDAAYLALAEALGAPLASCDASLAAAPGHTVRIELL